jgi:hypothetical protein
MSIQYRVAKSKKEEVVEGPDDADVVVTIAAGDVAMNPTVAYMQGKLKATGHTGVLLRSLVSGDVEAALSRLSSRL